MKDIIKYKTFYYLVSTENTFDRGWETTIFETAQTENIDKIDFNKVDFTDLYAKIHDNQHDALYRHYTIVKDIKKYLNEKVKNNGYRI